MQAESMAATCALCGGPVNAHDACRQVEGLAPGDRVHDPGLTSDDLDQRRYTGRVAHAECILVVEDAERVLRSVTWPCSGCGQPLDPSDPAVFHRVSDALVPAHVSDDDLTADDLEDVTFSGEVMCAGCMARRKGAGS